MYTGENLQAFRKIIDLCRLLSIALLLVHFFVIGYTWIEQYEYSNKFTQHLLQVFQQTTLLADNHRIKTFALSFLLTSLLGSRGRKGQQFNYNTAGIQIGLGLLLYFASGFLYPLTSYERIFFLYILMCITGFLLIIRGGAQVSRILKTRFFDHDLFNRKNQSFPKKNAIYTMNFRLIYPLGIGSGINCEKVGLILSIPSVVYWLWVLPVRENHISLSVTSLLNISKKIFLCLFMISSLTTLAGSLTIVG